MEQVYATYEVDDWSNTMMFINETRKVGNDFLVTTDRFSHRRCNGKTIQLNLTNVTCVGQENVTIAGIMDINTNGTSVTVKVKDTSETYTFALEGIQYKINGDYFSSYGYFLFQKAPVSRMSP